MEQNISPFQPKSSFPETTGKSFPIQSANSSGEVVNLGMYRLKKSLQKEGFEIVEDHRGKITLVVRVGK
jgi:hypothetical protein